MRYTLLFVFGLLLVPCAVVCQYFSHPQPLGGRLVFSYTTLHPQTWDALADKSYLLAFKPTGEVAWKVKQSELGVDANSFSFATLPSHIVVAWGCGQRDTARTQMHFAVLDSTGRRLGSPFVLNPTRDLANAACLGFWYLGGAFEGPNNGLVLELVTSDNGDTPNEARYAVRLDAQRRIISYGPAPVVARSPQGAEVFAFDSLSFNTAATRRFALRQAPTGPTPLPLMAEPLALPNARHYVLPPCTACIPGLARHPAPLVGGGPTNPAAGEARAGVGIADSVPSHNQAQVDEMGNPTAPSAAYALSLWGATQVYCTQPGKYVLATYGYTGYDLDRPDVLALVLAGVHQGRFVWRTVVYAPYATAYGNIQAAATPGGGLRLGASAVLREPETATAHPYGLTLELAPNGTLAGGPQWLAAPGLEYGAVHPVPGGGWCLSAQGKALSFYSATGQLLRTQGALE